MKLLSLLPFFFFSSLLLLPLCHAETQTSQVDFGIYYYLWYGQGLGAQHWNDTISNTVIDTPALGFYGSNNSDVMRQHLYSIKNAGFTFVILSVWDIHNYTYNNSILFMQTLQNSQYDLKTCVLIEPFNGTSSYDWPMILNSVYDDLYAPYGHLIYTLNNKFLLLVLEQCFENYDYGNATINLPQDDRFTFRIVGSHQGQSDWFYGDVMNKVEEDDDLSGRINRDGHINIFPRFDESHLGRSTQAQIDVTYGKRLYQRFWNLTYEQYKLGNVHIVTVASWNEYHERSAIEPHGDPTSCWPTDTTKLLEITKTNIAAFRLMQDTQNNIQSMSFLLPSIIALCMLAIAIGLVKYYVV